MAHDPQFVLKYMEEVEELAEDVLADKQQIIELDKKHNSNREALTALRKKSTAPLHSHTKSWLNFGGIFIKVTKNSAISMLEGDQTELQSEINNLQQDLHKKVDRLQDARGGPDLRGFDLKPLTPEELNRVLH